MKKIALAVLMVGMSMSMIGEANAVVCARGVYRAGCAGPRGAVVTHRPYGYHGAYYRPHCYWRAGVRVCR